ncbi:E3 ubiquitin-protein ligase SH3RF1-like isoform X2 [Tachypleus tridentatus]|uniref:E3 ubiquitin-protein ligase SH3RF1-like isoform X2 n=1 Tax=Tachypleus tridentatus TaxID=6853 RepID=UPI003FD3C9C2
MFRLSSVIIRFTKKERDYKPRCVAKIVHLPIADMDESFLNDLLECSVCFEQLDVTSKVLPCQHTFCKRCLEEIVTSHKELRCPECRVLVETQVDDLPANILLVRLLEGLKNNSRPSKTNILGGEHQDKKQTTPQHIASVGLVTTAALPAPQAPVPPSVWQFATKSGGEARIVPRQVPISYHIPCAKAVHSYESKEPRDLCFKNGDLIVLHRWVDQNWYYGEANGKYGYFPANHVQILVPLPPPLPQCKALYGFYLSSDRDERDSLSFSKGDIITVIRQIDENWAEGKLGERIGIFPISFVEMNSAARALIRLPEKFGDKPIMSISKIVTPDPVPEDTATRTCAFVNQESLLGPSTTPPAASSSPSPSTPCSSSSALVSPPTQSQHAASVTVGLLGSVHVTPISSPMDRASSHHREKRHSLSALSQRSLQSRGMYRHSMEVLGCNSEVGDSHDLDVQGPRAPPSSPLAASPSAVTTPMMTNAVNQLQELTVGKIHNLSIAEKGQEVDIPQKPEDQNLVNKDHDSSCTNVYDSVPEFYKPQKDDELELRKNDIYTVSEKCQDGWYKGTSLRTGRSGVFPGNYIQNFQPSVIQVQFQQSSSSVANIRSTAVQPSLHHPSSSVFSYPVHCTNDPTILLDNEISPPPQHVAGPSSSFLPSYNISSRSPGTSPVLFTRPQGMSVFSGPTVWTSYPAITLAASCPLTSGLYSQTTSITTFPNSSSNGSLDQIWVSAQDMRGNINPSHSTGTLHMTSHAIPQVTSIANGGLPINGKAEKKDKKDKERVGLVKRFTYRQKSKSPPSGNFSCDNPVFTEVLTCAGNPSLQVAHVRSGSCPSEVLQVKQVSHKKTSSLDSTNLVSIPKPCSRAKQPAPIVQERFRCIVPYPPNSEYELELKIGDVVYVHKKRDDGWYKGTLQRTGRVGLFPGSFVESF